MTKLRNRYFYTKRADGWAVNDRRLSFSIAICIFKESAELIVNALNSQEAANVSNSSITIDDIRHKPTSSDL